MTLVVAKKSFKRWFRSEKSGNGFRGRGGIHSREIEIVMVIKANDSRHCNNYSGNGENCRNNGCNFGGNRGGFGYVRRGCVQDRNSPLYRLRHLGVVEGEVNVGR